jgi:hypothetical protein
MATVAQADELSALKAQLEALQTKVDTMESSASSYNLPEGTSLLTGRRGAADYNFAYNHHDRPRVDGGENSGYTIAITPTADMPAPVAEITVSGYVSSWVSLGIDGHTPGNAGNFNPTTGKKATLTWHQLAWLDPRPFAHRHRCGPDPHRHRTAC